MDNPFLDVDKRIVAETYTSSEIIDNLRILCDIHGSRFPGTPGNLGSVEYIVEKLHEYGVENAAYETFVIPGWTRGPASLEVVSPIRKELEVIGLPHTVSGEIEARLIDLGAGHVDAYEEYKNEIRGSVVLVTNATPLGMKRHLHRSEKFNRSILAGAVGFIYMNRTPGYGPITGGMRPIIPAVGIGYEDGRYLQRIIERYGEVIIKVGTEGRNHDVETYNVIAEITAPSATREYAIVGSHYDGHDISQGAFDPASGAVTVMEIARTLNLVRDRLKRNLRFIWFGAEETGLYGSNDYVRTREGELDDCRFMLNLDSAGGPGRKGFIINDVPDLDPLVETWAREMNTELPYVQRVSPYSDHWPFFNKGVPTASGADPEISLVTPYGHTKYDTVDKIELEDLRRAAANYARFMFRVANVDAWDIKRKSADEIDAFITRQGYKETVALIDRVKAYVGTWDEVHPDTREWLKQDSAW